MRDPQDATGALRRGGRWNSPGVAVLYCSSSLSLACLEALVHIRIPTNLPPYIYAEISIPDELIRPWGDFEGRGRAILESLVLSREIGDDWVNYQPGPLSQAEDRGGCPPSSFGGRPARMELRDQPRITRRS